MTYQQLIQRGKPQSSTAILKRLLKFLAPHRKRFVVALLAMVVYGATDGAVPFLIRSVLDNIFGDKNKTLLYILPAVLIAFAILRAFFGFIQKYFAATVGLGIVRDLRNEINAHLLRFSPSFFEKHLTGALISRVTNDTLLVRVALTDAVASLLRDSIRIVALICAAFWLDPVLAVLALVGLPLGIWPIIRFGKRVRRLSKVGQDMLGGLTGILQETIVGSRIVQAFGMEEAEQRRFAAENEKFTETFRRAEKYGALAQPTNEITACIAIALVILYGGISVITGVRTQGDFIAFLTAMFLLYEPMKKLGRVNNIIQMGVAAAERIFEILDTKSDIQELPGASDLVIGRLSIEYDKVSFCYSNSEISLQDHDDKAIVLSKISLRINAGETLALVGSSGGGKSTMVSLLPRFYDPDEGRLLISGTDIREVTLESLRKQIAVVGQNTFLFNDTVFNNIAYGRSEATRDEVTQAAKAANAHAFISRLPMGYDTEIGEQGLMLSGGERQRVAIARALLKNAPILILDEATAALDNESEQLVQAAIDRLMAGRTVLVIAHRLTTIRGADKIAVLEHGELIEIGSHQELLDVNGTYAKLYRMQFADKERSLKLSA